MVWFVAVNVVVVVVAVDVGVGGRDPPILYITTPDRPPLRLLCYTPHRCPKLFNLNLNNLNNILLLLIIIIILIIITNITAAGAVDRELLYIELGDLFPPQHQQQQQQRTTTTINNNTNNQQWHVTVLNIDLYSLILTYID